MKIKTKLKPPFDATESGALSDLGFLLIIYFIVIAGFNINQGFLLDLPQKNSTKIVNMNDVIKIELEASGSLVYEKKEISVERMAEIIKEKISARPNMTLFLKIDSAAPYQNVVDIINIAKEINVDNFSFAMKKEKK